MHVSVADCYEAFCEATSHFAPNASFKGFVLYD